MWFKITGRHLQINAPKGRVLSFWLGAESKEHALDRCARFKIIDIEFCKEDPGFEERVK